MRSMASSTLRTTISVPSCDMTTASVRRSPDPEGIAYNEQTGHLFLVSSSDMKIFEFTVDGDFITDHDISHFYPAPLDPGGLTFAPSSDPSDDPDNYSLYIVDQQLDNMPIASLDRDGMVYEAAILPFDFAARKKVRFSGHETSFGTIHANSSSRTEHRARTPET